MPFDNERQDPEEICVRCGMPKLKKVVVQAIHDGPWPKSGSGKLMRTNAYYCPNCEPEPVSPGPPNSDPHGWERRMVGEE